ncbi:MAG: hypothetical protein ACI8Z1_001935 [Candidatus Azotimanducaceae bacterium]
MIKKTQTSPATAQTQGDVAPAATDQVTVHHRRSPDKLIPAGLQAQKTQGQGPIRRTHPDE